MLGKTPHLFFPPLASPASCYLTVKFSSQSGDGVGTRLARGHLLWQSQRGVPWPGLSALVDLLLSWTPKHELF
jgi:hypothetical protein